MSWIEKHQQATINLRQLAYEIRQISKNLRSVGNDYLYRELAMIADAILSNEKAAGDAIGEMLTEQVNQGQKAIHDTFMTILNGKTK